MDPIIYRNYIDILKEELIPALGCTEPIAIAYAAAKAASVLKEEVVRLEMFCSGNIIKNVQGVTVPNSGGLKGIEAAAILGAIGGNADKELEVLAGVEEDTINKTKALVGSGFCESSLVEGVSNLYILAKAFSKDNCAEVEIENKHTNIVRITLNNDNLFEGGVKQAGDSAKGDKGLLNVRDILEFADAVNINQVKHVLDCQIKMNTDISEEGLASDYGANVGKTLLSVYGNDIKIRAKARAAAGSDARMSGCSMPVVINSGSGNQGLTASLPVIEYARELNVSEDKLYRALVVSNLVALHQKKYIGNLSAYCGAVSAACGSGAAITYLYGGGYEAVSHTIANTIGNVGGIVCDGAKPSCAAKIASAVDAAIMANYMSLNKQFFRSGEGLIQDNVERTISNIGYVGRVGMKGTDIEILNVMLRKIDIDTMAAVDNKAQFTKGVG